MTEAEYDLFPSWIKEGQVVKLKNSTTLIMRILYIEDCLWCTCRFLYPKETDTSMSKDTEKFTVSFLVRYFEPYSLLIDMIKTLKEKI